MTLSTRTRFLPSLCIGLLIFFAAAAFGDASPALKQDDAAALPAGALKDASSRYLREAAPGPIRWQPWSDATFALAHKLKRPMLIDIGAVWCHWCHVMDDTTYSNPSVAAVLNSRYVPVKVDMDARPDVDAFYQNAAAHLTGAGGWPLTCFTTPSGTLLYAAGYLPPLPRSGEDAISAMVPLLERIADAYEKDPATVERQAAVLAKRIAGQSPLSASGGGNESELRREIIASLANSYDDATGGFGRSSGPRFYDFPAIRLALAYGFFQHDSFREMALRSLDKIARGGVFDQLGGGFHRYSTDQAWRVPHFEKMAYDQAMALSTYANAYQLSGDTRFRETAAAIQSYVNQTLLDPETHTFFADQDADSFPGDDGSYYTWTISELNKLLPHEVARAAELFYGMTDSPALAPDGRIVLRRPFTDEEMARRMGITPGAAKDLIARAKQTMLEAREKRTMPPVDRAIMTDRNALMISGYLAVADATADAASRDTGLRALDFILTHLRAPRGGFYHVWSAGQPSVPCIAADQVYMLNALVDAYQSSGDDKYLTEARSLADVIANQYRDAAGLLVNLHANSDRGAIAAPGGAQVMFDQPMPSIQADGSHAMRALGEMTSDARYLKIADALLAPAPRLIGADGDATLGTLGLALEEHADGGATVAIVGNPKEAATLSLIETALRTYRPGRVIVRIDPSKAKTAAMPPAIRAMYETATDHNAPLAFVCAGSACSRPSTTAEQLRRALSNFQIDEIARSLVISSGPVPAATTSP